MKRLLIWLGGGVAALAFVAVATLYLAPGVIVALTQWQAARSAGLEDRVIEVDGYAVHYFEGGTGPTLVMLHGMADDRHSFVGTAAALTDDYRVILTDLMGHGDNAADPDRDYSTAGQRGFVERFVEALDLEGFHLVGNSMGGHTSAAFALANPERVEKLVLVNAPGLVVDDTVVYGGFGAPITSRDKFDALMARVVFEPPSVPGPVKEYLIADTNARMEFINRLAESVRLGAEYDLSDRIDTLAVPTLILWGQEDVVVPFAVAEAYAEGVPDAELVLLPEAGHSPQLEAPDRVADAIRTFLETH
ncbi:alpha/beta fold hydrolase [Jannaschia marina]|uniref:alpha/beta fold hydrolase n=1 Tax=Jannaschia marina TaxID=2741674 RepID=UPI0015CA37DC|nr:alpha/beta fold hydrolase [Jannaschia marina]